MAAIPVLQKYTTEEITLINDFQDHKTLNFQINPRISFTITPPREKQPFNGVLTVEIGDMDDGSPLYIKVKVRAFLLPVTKQGDETPFDPEAFHRKAFPIVFDIARGIISTITQIGGMPPILLNSLDPSHINVEKK